MKIGIVVSKFNEFVTEKLLSGCVETLNKNDVKDIDVIKVPGAFELPTGAKLLLDKNEYDAVICLGAVIRGETPHFNYICSAISNQICRLGVDFSKPVVFGVITTDNVDQALARSGGKFGNKGAEAAQTAIEMIQLV